MEQLDLQRYVVRVLEQLKIPYFITGSVASIFFGEPRFTNDIDIVIRLREDQIPSLLAAFPTDQFYVSEDAMRQALRYGSQFNVIQPDSGLKVDLIIASSTELDELRFSRREQVTLAADFQAYFTSPEDLIIKKMQFFEEGGSEKHLRDIAGILKISGDRIDRQYIEHWSGKLGISEIWQRIRSSI